jgi:hypothetical protein
MNTITAKYLAIAHLFVGKNWPTDPRKELTGIFLTPHPSGTGALLVACNGPTMAVIHDPDGAVKDEGIYPLNRPAVAWCSKRKNAAVPVLFGAGAVTVGDEMTEPCEPLPVPYPQWRNVFPREDGEPRAFMLDPKLLALFTKAAALDGTHTISVGQFTEDSAVIVRIGENFTGLIMPLSGIVDVTLPEWLTL